MNEDRQESDIKAACGVCDQQGSHPRAAQGGGWSPYGIHMKATSTMWEVNGGLFFHPSY